MNFIKKKIKSHKKPHESDDDLYAASLNRTPREESAGETFDAKQDTEEWQFFQQLTQRVQDTVSKTQTVLTKLKDTSAVSEIDKPDYYFAEEEEAAKPLPPTVKSWIQFSEDGQPLDVDETKDDKEDSKGAIAPPRPPPPKSLISSSPTEKPIKEETTSEQDDGAVKDALANEHVPPVSNGSSAVDRSVVLSLLDDFTYQPEPPSSAVTLDVSGLLSDVDEGSDPFDTSFIDESQVTFAKEINVEPVVAETKVVLNLTEGKASPLVDAGSPDPFDTSFVDTGSLPPFSEIQELNNNNLEGLDFFAFDSSDKVDQSAKPLTNDGLLETFPSLSQVDEKSDDSKVCNTSESPGMSNPFLTDTAVSSSDFTTDFFGISSGREHDASAVLKQKTSTNPFETVDNIATSSSQDIDLLGASFQTEATDSAVDFASTSPFQTEQPPTNVFDPFGSVFDQKPVEIHDNGIKPDFGNGTLETSDNDPFGICSQPSSRRESSVRKESLPGKPFDSFPLEDSDSKRNSLDGIQLPVADTAKPDAFSDPFDSINSLSEKRTSVGSVKLPPVSEAEADFFDLVSKHDSTIPEKDQDDFSDPFQTSASIISPPQPQQTAAGFNDLDDIFGASEPDVTESTESAPKETHSPEENVRRDSTKPHADLLDDFFGGDSSLAKDVESVPLTTVETTVALTTSVTTAQETSISMTEDSKSEKFDPFFGMTQEKPEQINVTQRKPSLAALNPFEIIDQNDVEQESVTVDKVEKDISPKLEEPKPEKVVEEISTDLINENVEKTVSALENIDDIFGTSKTDESYDPFNVSAVDATLDSGKSNIPDTSGFLDFGVFDSSSTQATSDFSAPFVSGGTTFEPAKSSSAFTDTAAFEAFAAKFEQAIEKLDDVVSKEPVQPLDPFGGSDLSDLKSNQGDGKGFDTMDLFDPFSSAAKPPENTPTKLPPKVPSQDSFDDDDGPDFTITIKPKMRDVNATSNTDLGPPPLLPPPPKSPVPQVPASRFNPFNKDFGFPAEEVAQEEPVVAEPVVAPFETEPPPALGEAATKRTESQESPSTPLFDEDTSQPLEEFPPKFEGDGWEMMLRQPNKKKITGNRFWKKVYMKVSENSVLQLYNKKEDNDPFQELPLQACYSLSEIGAQQYDQYGKIFTVKLQYVFYRERVGVRPAQISKVMQGHITSVGQFAKLGLPLEHAPQVSQLLKIGTQCYTDMKTFVQVVEDALFHLTVHRDRALTYKTEEVQVAVHDELYVEQNKMGHIVKQQARVRVFFLAFITGMPDVEVGINDMVRQGKEVVGRHDIIPVVTEEWIRLENCEFHSCVMQEEFEKNRIVKLHPPDACFFELLRFRIRPPRNRELPLQIKAIMKIVKTKVEVRIDVLVPGYHSRKHGQVPCEDVQIRFPMPECWIYLFRVEKHFRYGSLKSAARKPGKIMGLDRIMGTAQNIDSSLIEVSAGQAKYEHAFRAVVWRIPRLPKEGHGAYTTQLLLMRLELTSFDQIPSSFSQYLDVEFSMPATTVSHTTIRSVSVTNQNPPEKYVRYVAKHDYKVEIDLCFESEESEYVAAATAAAAAAQVSSPPPSSETPTVEEEDDSD